MQIIVVGASAPSHTYPQLAVVAELVRRGHHVRYLTGEPLTALAARTGAEVLGHPTVLPEADTAWPEDPMEASHLFLDDQVVVAERLAGLPPADAVLYDIGGYGGRVAAHHWGVPAVQLSPAMVAWEGYEEDMADVLGPLRASPAGQRLSADLAAWLAGHGIPGDPEAFVGRPDRAVVLIPRVMQPNADRVGDHHVFAGPAIDETRRSSGFTPRGDRPVLYVALGTAYTDRPDLYRAVLDGCGDAYEVIIATGKVDPTSLGPVPDGAHIARTQPQLDVLDAADVFVTHAGMGSIGEALWAGVPMVAFPQAVDQPMNAELLVGHGLGVVLEHVTADAVRHAASTAAEMRPAVLAQRDEIRRHGGAAHAADAVERAIADLV